MSLSLFQVHEKEIEGQAQSRLLKLLGVTGSTLNSEPQIFCSTAPVDECQGLLHPPPWNALVLMPTGILFFSLILLGVKSSLTVSPGRLFCWQRRTQLSTDENCPHIFFPICCCICVFWGSSLLRRVTSRNCVSEPYHALKLTYSLMF